MTKFMVRLVLVVVFVGSCSLACWARTTCEIQDDKKIVITLYIAFEGAWDDLAQRWAQEIVDVWNGPSYERTYGECGCPVVFEVKTQLLNKGSSWPDGWHYIRVLMGLPGVRGANGERAIAYIGRNVPSPPPLGLSGDGEWAGKASHLISGSTTGERFKHAAHEAGHLMGLCDDYSETNHHIMGPPRGSFARPTPDQIREIIQIVTGKPGCPLCAKKAQSRSHHVGTADLAYRVFRKWAGLI